MSARRRKRRFFGGRRAPLPVAAFTDAEFAGFCAAHPLDRRCLYSLRGLWLKVHGRER